VIIAQARDGFQGPVAATLDGPFVVPFEQNCADEANNGVLVGEDADNLGAALDLAVNALERVSAVQLDAVLRRERHVGEHVRFRLVQKAGELGQLGSQLVGDLAPLSSGAFQRRRGRRR
jgi:hypothetical protein